MMLLFPNLSSVLEKKLCTRTPKQSLIFAIFVEHSHEKCLVNVTLVGSTVGLHRISNEVCLQKFSLFAALLLTS